MARQFLRLTISLSLLKVILAASDTFTWKVYAPDTVLEGCTVYVTSSSNIKIDNTTTTMTGQIEDDGTLLTNGEYTMGIGRNYLSTESLSSAWITAVPWTIEGGYLKLYGSDFHAVPDSNLNDGTYVLGSINAASGRSDVIEVKIIPVDDDGNVVSDYVASSSSSADATTTTSATETTETSAEATTESTTMDMDMDTETSTTVESTTSESTAAESTAAESTGTVSTSTEETTSSEDATTAEQTTTAEGATTTAETTSAPESTTLESSTTAASSTAESSGVTVSTYDNGAAGVKAWGLGAIGVVGALLL